MDFRITDLAMLKSDLNSLYARRETIINEIRVSGVLNTYEEFTKNPSKL